MKLRIAGYLYPLMFGFSVNFLIVLAIALQPLFTVLHRQYVLEFDPALIGWFQLTLFLAWLPFVLELAFWLLVREPGEPIFRGRAFAWAALLIPPLRICATCPTRDAELWLPVFGWVTLDRDTERRVERGVAIPMLFVALLILPVLGLELLGHGLVRRYTWVAVALDTATSVIWFAFALEFVVLLAVARKKLRYCIRHWIDLAIILLPVLAAARWFRLLSLGRVLKLQQLTKMSRLYRLRATGMRVLRVILVFKLAQRLLGASPEKELERLREVIAERELELAELREQMQKIEALLEEEERFSLLPHSEDDAPTERGNGGVCRHDAPSAPTH